MTPLAPPPLLSLLSARSGGFTLLAVLLIFVLAADVPVLAEGNYRVVPLDGIEALEPMSVKFNNEGQLIGTRIDEDGVRRAIYRMQIDNPASQFELQSSDPSGRTSVGGLNNLGQAVGGEHFWSEEHERELAIAILWDVLVLDNPIALPAPEAVSSIAYGISDSGHIWGAARYGEYVPRVLWIKTSDEGEPYAPPVDLNKSIPLELNATTPVITGISQPLEGILTLAGRVQLPQSASDYWYWAPCVWFVYLADGENEVEIDFQLLQHDEEVHYNHGPQINSLGDVVAGNINNVGFVWHYDGGYGNPVDIGNLGRHHWKSHDDRVRPHGINALGQVVGLNSYATSRQGGTWHHTAFIWQDGVMLDLNELLPSGHEFAVSPAGTDLRINDYGEILGRMEDGLWYLAIPEANGPTDPEEPEEPEDPEAPGDPADPGEIEMIVLGIEYDLHRNGRHLDVTVWVVDEDGGVPGVAVQVAVSRNGSHYQTDGGTTSNQGAFTFRLSNAPSGTYSVTITDLSKDGWEWDGDTPTNSFQKP